MRRPTARPRPTLHGRSARAVAAGTVAAAAAAGATLARTYRDDLQAQRRRLRHLPGRSATTSRGEVVYVEFGEGPAVLAVHGIAGGHDQGSQWARTYLPTGFRVVAPSRFGYLGSTMPPDATPTLQADVLVELLDALSIDHVGVVALSAGATSALQLALRHPARVSHLVLSSPNAPGPVAPLPPRPLIELAVRTDVPFWALTRFGLRLMRSPMLGVPATLPLTPTDQQDLRRIASEVLPITDRREGFLFDMFISNPEINDYPLADITTPTLVISAVDDAMAPHGNAKAMAEAIPGARLLAVQQGGHPLFGATEQVSQELHRFLTHPIPQSEPS